MNEPSSAINENELLDFTTLDASSANTRLSISQSLSSSIPIKQSLAKAMSESYSDAGKITKVNSRRKSAVKRSDLPGGDDDGDDEDGDGRKKRDNMNDKIQELLALVPDDYFSDARDKATGTKDGKPNKGQILTKGVDYIQDLQNKIDENNRTEVELVWKLKKLSHVKNTPITDIQLSNTSAEIVLADIGVGPLATVVQQQQTHQQTEKSPNNNFEYGGYDQYS